MNVEKYTFQMWFNEAIKRSEIVRRGVDYVGILDVLYAFFFFFQKIRETTHNKNLDIIEWKVIFQDYCYINAVI